MRRPKCSSARASGVLGVDWVVPPASRVVVVGGSVVLVPVALLPGVSPPAVVLVVLLHGVVAEVCVPGGVVDGDGS